MSKQTDMWMPIVIGDYLRDTQRLTTEQHGAYFLLLLDYWTNGPMPADDAVLCSISRLKMARFRKHKKALLSFFTVVDGELRHKRADAEKARAIQNAKRNSEKAKHAAEVRWQRENGDAPSNAPSNATSNAPECPSPSPSVTNVTAAPTAVNQAKLIFDRGLSLLMAAGVAEGGARAFLGKCRGSVGDDYLAELIRHAERQNITDLKPYLLAACAKRTAESSGDLGPAISTLAARKAAQQAA